MRLLTLLFLCACHVKLAQDAGFIKDSDRGWLFDVSSISTPSLNTAFFSSTQELARLYSDGGFVVLSVDGGWVKVDSCVPAVVKAIHDSVKQKGLDK